MDRNCAIIRQHTQEQLESERVAEGPRHEKRDGPGDGSTGRTRQSGSTAPLWSLCSGRPRELGKGAADPAGWVGRLGRARMPKGGGLGKRHKGQAAPCNPPTPMVDVTGDSDRQQSWPQNGRR